MENFSDHLIAIGYILSALGLTLVTWFFHDVNEKFYKAGILIVAMSIILLTISFPGKDVWVRFAAVMVCSLFPVKLFDAAVHYSEWKQDRFSHWCRFVISPVLICRDMMELHMNVSPRKKCIDLFRGIVEVSLGIIIWNWVVYHAPSDLPFFCRYPVMLIASYLFLWDGGCVLFVAVWRLFGGNVIDFSNHPIAAKTPADFWRRYNRWIGFYCFKNFFLHVKGLTHPFLGILLSFVIMGLFHEYLITVISKRLTGYIFLFFLINGLVTGLTFKIKPTGLYALLSRALTLLYLIAVSYLVYLTLNQFYII